MVCRWVAIQRNPTSGNGRKRSELLAFCQQLRRNGIRPRIFSRREALANRINRSGGRDGLVCLVAAGGDGTVRDLANRFPDVPLAILPLGTENLLAKYLGVPCDGRFVAQMIADDCRKPLDVGLLNGRRFLLMASAGFDADIVHRTHARRTGHIRKWNYLQPILQTLRSYGYPELRLHVTSGESLVEQTLVGHLAVLANLPVYAMGLPIAKDAVGHDGLLDLRLFERPEAFQMARYLYNVARTQHEALPDVRIGRIRRVRIDSDVPAPIQCDGDPAGWTPADVFVLPGALTLIVPEGSSSGLSESSCCPQSQND
jgi:diacylglycerol kinase family enzyme